MRGGVKRHGSLASTNRYLSILPSQASNLFFPTDKMIPRSLVAALGLPLLAR